MRRDESRHRMFPVGLYATLLIGLFGVTFPELLAPVEALGRTIVTLPLRAYSILLDEQPAYAAATPGASSSIAQLDATAVARRGAVALPGFTARPVRVLRREVGPLGFVDTLILSVTWQELRGASPVVTSGDDLVGFLAPRTAAGLDPHALARVHLLHHRARRSDRTQPLGSRLPFFPARVAAAVPCREIDAQGVLHCLVEPARAVDRWPLRCTLLDDSYLGARLRTSGDVVRTIASEDPPLPAGLAIGRLRIWGYPEHDIPVGLFVEPLIDPRAISSVMLWLPGDGGAIRMADPPYELRPVRFTRFPAPRPTFERWMVTSTAGLVLPDGAALVDGGRLLGRLRQPWSGQSLVTPFAASTASWALLLKQSDGDVHEIVGRVLGRDERGRVRIAVLARDAGTGLRGELFTGSNGAHCPAGIRIGKAEPGRLVTMPRRTAMANDDRRRDADMGEMWVTLDDAEVRAPHVCVHRAPGGRR